MKARTEFSLLDVSLLLIFLFFGFVSRTFRIQFPPQRVFDECHFGGFTNDYLNHVYFHDIHPPLGKLIFAASGWLAGYDGHINFSGDAIYGQKHYVQLRMTPASFSALIPALSYLGMRLFGFSIGASSLSAILLGVESMLIIEARLVLIDGFLHTFTVMTVTALAFFHANPDSRIALAFLGIAAGCTFSVKYTGASVIVFVGIYFILHYSRASIKYLFTFPEFRNFFNASLVKLFLTGTIFLTVAVLVMYSSFLVHVMMLHYRSSQDAFLPPQWRSTLIPRISRDFSPRTRGISLFKRISLLIVIMHRTNMGITEAHSASSKWWQWPLVLMPGLTYFSNQMSLVLHPNPFVWYPAALGPLFCLIAAALGYFLGRIELCNLGIWAAGYFASLLPFALIPRVIFVYHYLVPLIFGVFAFAAAIDVLMLRFPVAKNCFFVVWFVMAAASWVFFAPWCYAMTGYDWGIRTWYRQLFD
jgi:dolichyl-phosphate-mannose--protein O-mannosyl transferase